MDLDSFTITFDPTAQKTIGIFSPTGLDSVNRLVLLATVLDGDEASIP